MLFRSPGFLFACILALGSFVRLFLLGEIPGGLNPDEASMGYDAFALLKSGHDRMGSSFPVHMIAWGSGQNALMAYFTIPFIALLDLSVLSIRLVPALFGIVTLILFYMLALRLQKGPFALIALFLLTISPWHICLSRWALESNMLPGVILIAMYFLLRSQENSKFLVVSVIFFALSLYAYSSAYAFVPLFLLCYGIYALINRLYSVRIWVISVISFALISLPIFLFVLVNRIDSWPTLQFAGITIPKLPGGARYSHMSSLFSSSFFSETLANIKGVLGILTGIMNHGDLHSNVTGVGIVYSITIPLFLIGLVLLLLRLYKRQTLGAYLPILLWLFFAFIVAIVSPPAVHRMNLLFLPLLLIAAYGITKIWERQKWFGVGILVVYAVLFVRFEILYHGEWADRIADDFFYSYTDAVDFAYAHASASDTLYCSNHLNEPYIHILFTTKLDPKKFRKTAVIPNPNAAFHWVTSFDRFVIGLQDIDLSHANVLVAKSHELSNFSEDHYYFKHFKNFSALFRKDAYKLDEQGIPQSFIRKVILESSQTILQANDSLIFAIPESKSSTMVIANDFYHPESQSEISHHRDASRVIIRAKDLPAGISHIQLQVKFADEDLTIEERTLIFVSSQKQQLLEGTQLQGTQDFGHVELNRSYDAKPLHVGFGVIPWGFGTHANSSYSYSLQQNFDSLYFSYGISKYNGACGDGALFEIRGDDQVLWSKKVALSEYGQERVAIAKVQNLQFNTRTLDNSLCDHTNWLGVVLVQ